MPSSPYVKTLTALFTASAGVVTWRSAREPRRVVDRDQPIGGRPFVIAVPQTDTVEIALTGNDLSMKLWNVGKEPAIVDTVSLSDDWEDLLAWGLTRCHVQPGAAQDLRWPLPQRVPDDGERCTLRISYRDGSGIRYVTASELRVGRPSCECANYMRTRVGAAR
jgi:hypothetical protein